MAFTDPRISKTSFPVSQGMSRRASRKSGRRSVVADDLPGEGAMTALHPNQIWLLRIRGLITVVTMVLPIIVLDLALRDQHLLPAGLAPGLFALTGLIALILLPKRRYRGWAYREGEDELHIRHGLLMRVQTVVPFGRVQ